MYKNKEKIGMLHVPVHRAKPMDESEGSSVYGPCL